MTNKESSTLSRMLGRITLKDTTSQDSDPRKVTLKSKLETFSSRRGQPASALGKRVWKSSKPTHWGMIVTRTMLAIIPRSCLTQAFP